MIDQKICLQFYLEKKHLDLSTTTTKEVFTFLVCTIYVCLTVYIARDHRTDLNLILHSTLV